MTKVMSTETVATLDQAIKDFNGWTSTAKLYYNQKHEYFDVEVFKDDMHATGTVFSDDCFVVFGKTERQGSLTIGDKRKQYILDFVDLVNDGWEPFQAEYQLLDKYPPYL